jgi:hypothetical protein
MFGFLLGLGVVAAIPSNGFYVVIAWATSADWGGVWPVFLAFVGARAAPLLVALALGPRRTKASVFAWTARRLTPAARPLEAALLAAAAVIVLT